MVRVGSTSTQSLKTPFYWVRVTSYVSGATMFLDGQQITVDANVAYRCRKGQPWNLIVLVGIINAEIGVDRCEPFPGPVAPMFNVARRIQPDSNDYLVWTLDESALPLIQTVATTPAGGNFDVFVAPNTAPTYGVYSNFSNGLWVNVTTAGIHASGSAGLSSPLANNFSFSAWLFYYGAPAGLEMFCKAYRAIGAAWAEPFASILIGTQDNLGNWGCNIAVGGVRKVFVTADALQSPYRLGPAANQGYSYWRHIGATYDSVAGGGTGTLYIDGRVAKVVTGLGGPIDFNGNVGPWFIGRAPTNAFAGGGMSYIFDDIRVAKITRPASYFQTIYSTAMGIGNT